MSINCVLNNNFIRNTLINNNLIKNNKMFKDNRMIILGIGASATIGSIFLYYYMKNTNSQIVVETEEPYENKYYDKFDLLEVEELEEDYVKGLKNNILYESTPKGKVIMYYDHDKESFIYYCDTKDISYLYLEAVARKYALTYSCKKIVVDIKAELKRAKDIKAGNNVVDSKSVGGDKSVDGLFASFKEYNKKSGVQNTMNKKFVLRQNANRYSYKGKIKSYSFIKSDEYKSEKYDNKLDYGTFKRLMEKKN